jgi:NADPH:quinone reductase-like Zn-dependent oxidoreductase
MPADQMKAVVIENFGGIEALKITSLPVPEPGASELLVKNHAAGVNPVDYKIRSGKYPAVRQNMLPFVMGRDASGLVASVGSGDTPFAVGTEVFGMPDISRGTYAEYVVLRNGEAAFKPSTLDHVGAAAVPLAGLTAWQGLFTHGDLQPGQIVLIHGGSGGVGHLGIQFAKAKGATVITTVSTDHLDFVKRLGADQVIDYKRQRFEDEVRDVDVVFDLIGGDTQERSFAVLRKGGVLVSTLTAPPEDRARQHGVRALRYTVKESGAELAEIARLIDAGKVTVVVADTFALSEAAAAQSALEHGHIAGKLVLRMT